MAHSSNPPGKIDPYAVTGGKAGAAAAVRIRVQPDAWTVLSGSTAGRVSAGFTYVERNHMFQWLEGSRAQSAEWPIAVVDEAEYEVAVVIANDADCDLTVALGDQILTHQLGADGWTRVELGRVSLTKGEHQVRLMIDAAGTVRVCALELVQPATKQAHLTDALAVRQTPEWFKAAGLGLMFQWTNRATPPTGPIKQWEQKVNDFELQHLLDAVEASGASFVIWSITWGQQYLSAPNAALDAVISGRTRQRDLLGELADRLQAKGVRLIFYYHYGYDCYHSKDPEWMDASGGYRPDKTAFFDHVMRIIAEVGQRYGDKLNGWFFDGGHRYYDTHYDGSPAHGMLSVSFQQLGHAARTGNPKRVICYNPWVKPRYTEYQDFFAGEGKTGFSGESLEDGVFKDGPQAGLMAFGCRLLEGRWGHIDENTPIPAPQFTADKLATIISQARLNRHPLAINLEMYEDGSVSPASIEVLRDAKRISVRAE